MDEILYEGGGDNVYILLDICTLFENSCFEYYFGERCVVLLLMFYWFVNDGSKVPFVDYIT